jgi:hypothetical protein
MYESKTCSNVYNRHIFVFFCSYLRLLLCGTLVGEWKSSMKIHLRLIRRGGRIQWPGLKSCLDLFFFSGLCERCPLYVDASAMPSWQISDCPASRTLQQVIEGLSFFFAGFEHSVTYSGFSIHDGTLLHSRSQYTTVKHSQQLFEHTYTSNLYGLGTLTPI